VVEGVGKDGDLAQPTQEELLPPAPQDELEGMIGHFEALLEPKGYFFPKSAPLSPAAPCAAC
jgi:tRNA/rRNA methyltransferase